MNFSEQQQKSLNQIRDILMENFDSYSLTVRSTNEAGDFDVRTFWEGSLPEAIGLAHMGAMRMDQIAMMNTDFGIMEDE